MNDYLIEESKRLEHVIDEEIIKAEEDLKIINSDIDRLTAKLQEKEMKTDRSENADFQIAKDTRDMKMSIKNLMLQRIESLRSEKAEYKPTGFITLGTTVHLKLLSIENQNPNLPVVDFIYKVVKHSSSNARKHLLAIDSVVGKNIIGRRKGDTVSVYRGTLGTLEYLIKEIY